MKKPNFKMTKFYVDDNEEAIELQKAMFVLGFKWIGEPAGKVREPRCYFNDGGYLYVDQDCRISWSGKRISHPISSRYASAFQSAVLAAAKDHKEQKKKERKQSRKRKAARKAGFTVNNGTQPNVPGKVEVLFNEGTVDASGEVHVWHWGAGPEDWKILGWRLPKPVTATLEEMVTDIADNIGKGVTTVDTSEGWISWDGTNFKSDSSMWKDGTMHGPVLHRAVIDVMYRSGEVRLNQTNGVSQGVAGAYWERDDIDNDIIAYRLSKAVLKVESLSSLGSFDGTVTVGEVTTPDTNPKKQYGLASIPLEMWPDLASAYGALGLYNGALKYGKANFANTPVEASIYIAAARRHLASWAAGEEFDQADGVPHLGGVLANIAILLSARAAGTLIDDRMLLDGWLKERDTLKAIVPKLQEVHAGKTPKHYTRESA